MADFDKYQTRYFADRSHKLLLHWNSPKALVEIW